MVQQRNRYFASVDIHQTGSGSSVVLNPSSTSPEQPVSGSTRDAAAIFFSFFLFFFFRRQTLLTISVLNLHPAELEFEKHHQAEANYDPLLARGEKMSPRLWQSLFPTTSKMMRDCRCLLRPRITQHPRSRRSSLSERFVLKG